MGQNDPQSQIVSLRERIVELREMLSLYAGTASESFIREHIHQLQERIQVLLQEAAADRAASRYTDLDFQKG
jgi:hypothetical protein